MANDKPYLWLGKTATPGNYTLVIDIPAGSNTHNFDLGKPTSVDISPNDRLTLTYTPLLAGAGPLSISIPLNDGHTMVTNSPKTWSSAIQKITVKIMDGTTVLGSTTVLTQRADPNQTS